MSRVDSGNPLPPSRDVRVGPLTVHFNWFIALCVVMTCGMFINLGLWQLERAAEKREREAAWEQMQSAAPVSLQRLESLLENGDDPALQNGRPVRLSGQFLDPAVSFLVQYQFHQGQPGFEVVTPFRPQGAERLVLISRGWVAASPDGSAPGPQGIGTEPAATGDVELVARLHQPDVPPQRRPVRDREWPLLVPVLHPGQAADLLGENVYPWQFRLASGEPGMRAAHWSAPDFGRRMHYGYAFQWFLFTALVVLASVWLGSDLPRVLRNRSRSG